MAAQKIPMTEAERLELAAKLDKDLDDFIDSLEKKPYEDGWPEDRWKEVITQFVSNLLKEFVTVAFFSGV